MGSLFSFAVRGQVPSSSVPKNHEKLCPAHRGNSAAMSGS